MSHWIADNSQSIGRAPLIRLNRITEGAVAAVRQARLPGNAGKTSVVVLPDSGARYLGPVLFEGIFDASGLPL